jgi:hypothetical protein
MDDEMEMFYKIKDFADALTQDLQLDSKGHIINKLMVMSLLCWKGLQINMDIPLVHQLKENSCRRDVVIKAQQFKVITTSADYGIPLKI